jgi:hypothetical protein
VTAPTTIDGAMMTDEQLAKMAFEKFGIVADDAEIVAFARALLSASKPAAPSDLVKIISKSLEPECAQVVDDEFFNLIDAAAPSADMQDERGAFFDVVFDGPPSHVSGRFVEVEDEQGRAFNAGEWVDRGNGLWALRIPRAASTSANVAPAATVQAGEAVGIVGRGPNDVWVEWIGEPPAGGSKLYATPQSSQPVEAGDSAIIDCDIDMGRAVEAATREVSLDDERAAFEWPSLPSLPNQSFYAFDRALFTAHQMQGYANAYGELVRAASPQASETRTFTGEQIAALRVAADALVERYAAPIRAILANAEHAAASQPAQTERTLTDEGTDYEALEREHLGDADLRTGIYADPERIFSLKVGPALTPFGMLVRALRIVAGTTLHDMAKNLSSTPATLSSIEFGRKPLTDAMIADTSAYFSGLGIHDTLHALKIAAQPASGGAA